MRKPGLLGMNQIISSEPYKVLFTLGASIAILASLLWFIFEIGWISFYPRTAHSNLMFFGFLWSFIAGFLMTAVPKMTKTDLAGPIEMSLTLLLIIAQVFLNLNNQVRWSIGLFFAQAALLLFFGGVRVFKSGKIPFTGFVFLPVGLFQAIFGSVLYISEWEPVQNAAYILCGEALVFNLILGLGSRLIPVISRVPNALSPDVRSKKELWLMPLTILLLLNTGIWMQVLGFSDLGSLLKMTSIAFAAVSQFGLLKKPVVFSSVGWGIKIAISLMLSGQLLNLNYFGFGLAAMHLVYIGGFALLTIMISFRVIVAHGGQDISYEVSSKRIAWISYVLAVAAVLRFAGMFNYASPYISASIVLVSISMLMWLGKHFKILSAGS